MTHILPDSTQTLFVSPPISSHLKEELSLYSATQLEEAYIPSLRSYCIQVWPDCIFCSEFQKTNAKVLARPKILSEALLAEFCSLW